MEVLTWQELVLHLGSRWAARRAVADEEWRRVLRGTYVPATVEDSLTCRAAAIRRLLPEGVAVGYRSALWLLGVDASPTELDVIAERGRHLESRPGLRPHSALLPDSELVVIEGLLVASAARALVDVARSEPLVEAVALGDAALRLGVTDLERVAAAVDRAAGLRHVERARLWLTHLEPRSESFMESRMRMVYVLGGLPRPVAQYDLYDAQGHVARADMWIEGVVFEYDGRAQRLEKAAFVGDRSRQTRIAELACEVRRLTSHDYYVRPHSLGCAEARRAIEQAASRDRSSIWTGPDTLRRPRQRPLPTLADLAARAA